VPRRPCVIDGMTFPTQRAAAEALGISYQAVSLRLKMAERRGPDWKPKPPGRAKPVTVHGVAFPTMKAASEALGIPYGVIQHWARVGRWPNRKVRENRRKHPPPPREPVIIDGVAYLSIKDAADKLGVRYGVLYRRLKRPRRTKQSRE
jgi:hypothetical protein